MHQLLHTEFYILLGALAVGLMFRPSSNLLEIRYAFVVTVLLGLCGPSFLLLLTGERVENAFMVPKLVPIVYRYATVCVVFFWIGYHAMRWRWWGRAREAPPPVSRPPSHDGRALLVTILVLATVPLVLEIVNYGTDYVFGKASVVRGFYAQNKTDKPLLEYTRVLGKALSFPVAVVAGVAWRQRRQNIYWLVPVLLSIPLIAYFSRGMFLPFVIFLMGASFFLTPRKRVIYLAIASVFAVTSFLTGIAMRKYTENTGLAQYGDLFEQNGMETPVDKSMDNPLSALIDATDALSVATKVFEVGPRIEGRMWKGYLLVQLPIPSFLLPKGVPTTNLTDDLHFHGARFPYPLMGEMFVFVGWGGTLVYILLGLFAGWTDRTINDKRSLIHRPYFTAIVYGLVLFIVIREFHSGLRSSLRPTMYFFGAYWIWTVLRRPRAVVVAPRDPLVDRIKMLPPRQAVDRIYPSSDTGLSG